MLAWRKWIVGRLSLVDQGADLPHQFETFGVCAEPQGISSRPGTKLRTEPQHSSENCAWIQRQGGAKWKNPGKPGGRLLAFVFGLSLRILVWRLDGATGR